MPSPPLPTGKKPTVLCPYHYWNGESPAGFQAHAAGDLPASAKRSVFSAAQLFLQAPGYYPCLALSPELLRAGDSIPKIKTQFNHSSILAYPVPPS